MYLCFLLFFSQVYIPLKREASKKEMQYKQRMDSVFSDKEFVDTIRCLIPAVHEYLSSVAKLVPKVELQVVVASNTFKNLVDFAVLCLEVQLLSSLNTKMLVVAVLLITLFLF